MCLDLLAFFGTFIVAALLSQALIPERVRTESYFGGVFVICVIYDFLVFSVPFRSVWTELLCFGAGLVTETLILSCVPSNRPQKGPVRYHGFLRAATFFLMPFVAFPIFGRVHQAQKMAKKLDGVVTRKYSGDHGVPSIVVAQRDGSTASIEGVDPSAWNLMRMEKSRLTKPAWSAFGQIDGKPMRIIPKAKVMFLGPFPD